MTPLKRSHTFRTSTPAVASAKRSWASAKALALVFSTELRPYPARVAPPCSKLLPRLAEKLTEEFGRGFDASNLRYMRLFYLAFPICDALRHELSWTH